MDHIKDAFKRVKEDINSLKEEIKFIKTQITEISTKMGSSYIQKEENSILDTSTHPSTDRHIIPTDSTHPSTDDYPFRPLKPQNLAISTGNEGVSTDRQTDRQTDRHIDLFNRKENNDIDDAIKMLDSLDDIKKEIRLKFKRLTEQEFLVFSSIYRFDEELGYTDYKTLSNELNLTESSIRDYVGRLIKKGIPVDKIKINNKNIQLSISENLKKIATLSTILQLRDL